MAMQHPRFRGRLRRLAPRTWLSAVRRGPVEPPRLPPGTATQEEDQRRPITAELRQVYKFALLSFTGLTFILVPVLLLTYMSGSGLSQPLSLLDVIEWVRTERTTWRTEILLGLPVTVLFPSVLTVVLTSAFVPAPGTSRSPRQDAYLEIVRNVLHFGLLLSASFAVLAAIPPNGRSDLPVILLAIAIAVGCLLLAGTLPIFGTQKELIIARAKGHYEATDSSLTSLRNYLLARCPKAKGMLRPGWRGQLKAILIGTAMIGILPALVFGILFIHNFGSPPTWVGLVILLVVLVVLGAYLAAQAFYSLYFRSRWRLAATRGEKVSSLAFLAVPVAVLLPSLLTMAFLPPDAPSHEVWSLLVAFVLALVTADVLAFVLNQTIFATILDIRRLMNLRAWTESQIAYLDGTRDALAG